MACTPAILANLETSAKFFNWLDSQRDIADPLMETTRTLTSTETARLDGIASTLNMYKACLSELGRSVSSINTENSRKNEEITRLNESINKRQLDVQISQDRALMARHPEMSRSYYESILPIGRPMSHYTVPILIGISTFLLSLSFFMFLNMKWVLMNKYESIFELVPPVMSFPVQRSMK
jgi:PP-loop superfamily ATP-utilizing enzyme